MNRTDNPGLSSVHKTHRAARPDVRSEPLSELEVLQGISRAFGSSTDVEEASTAAVRWISAAVGTDDAPVQIYLRGRDGTLAPLLAEAGTDTATEARQIERQRVLESRRPVRSDIPVGRALVTMPLLSRGDAVGVLEVVAPADAVEKRWATLEAVASQVAIVFRNLSHRAAMDSSFEGLREMASLAGAMVRAGSDEEAVRAAVGFCHERFGLPVAGWLSRNDRDRLELLSVRGLGSSGRHELRSQMRNLRRADLSAEPDRRKAAERFAAIAGLSRAEAIVAGGACILAGGTPASPHASFRLVESLLEDVLGHLSVVTVAARRNERLDLGIAWTAHEVRGPLIGSLAIIERLLMSTEDDGEDRGLLERSQRQLEQLTSLVDGLLRWAVVGEPLELAPTDLVPLVREAVESCSRDSDRVSVSLPESAIVRAEPDHLRGAIANVVRNALWYSPRDTSVSVKVEAEDRAARVIVQDHGPGVPPEERESIFDPFMRGSAADLARGGRGLGLFIARRVIEAHGGSIWVGGNGQGATFQLELPTAAAERGASSES